MRSTIPRGAGAGVGVCGRGQHQNAVTDGTDGTLGAPEVQDLALEYLRAEVLAHAGSVAAGKDQAVEVGRVEILPARNEHFPDGGTFVGVRASREGNILAGTTI